MGIVHAVSRRIVLEGWLHVQKEVDIFERNLFEKNYIYEKK